MKGEKSVLVVGLDPTLIDFSLPGYPPGMTATKVFAGMKSSEDELTRLGYSVQTCLTDFGDTAEAVVQKPTRAEAVRLRPYWGRCKSEPKQLHPV